MDIEGLPLIIGIDWKFVGRDYLAFFPHNYPHLEFFRSDAFEELSDDLANELPENCFAALSSFLGGFGYELWNINTGGDDYALLVAASGMGDATCQRCLPELDDDGEGPEYLSFERLAPDALPTKPSHKRASAKAAPLIVEDDWHSDYGGVWRNGMRYVTLTCHDEDGEEFTYLVDLATFPLDGIDAKGFFALRDSGHGLYPRHDAGEGQYWVWEKPQKRKIGYEKRVSSLVLISDYDTPQLEEVEQSERLDSDNGQYAGFGRILFQVVKSREQAAWRDSEAPLIGGMPKDGGQTFALLRIEGKACQHIADIPDDACILPMSEHEIAVIEKQDPDPVDDPDRAGPAFHLIDCGSRHVVATGKLPFAHHWSIESIVALDADEILYARSTIAPHSGHSALREATGWLVRVNLRSGEWRHAKLDGLHDDYTTNMAMLRHQKPDRYRIRSFEGSLSIERGHDDWFILNYITSSAGKHDLAWLWNKQDDRILKITPQDFPRREVTIHWHKGKERYVADESCRLSLLPPFEDILQSCRASHLHWNAA